MKKKKLVCSFSSGLSSALMAHHLKQPKYQDEYEIIFIMANTGKEDDRSLEFAHKCDQYFGLNLVWVEAQIMTKVLINGVKHVMPYSSWDRIKSKLISKGVSEKYIRNKYKHYRQGTTFLQKTFKTLSRKGQPFEQGIKKYGIPSMINKWCNRELKLSAIHKYTESIGWGKFGKDYYTAIGIRSDEIDRVSKYYAENKLKYPLIELGVTTKERNEFWHNMPFTLELEDWEGNCDMCFEKSDRKLATKYLRDPESLSWWDNMESIYGDIKLESKPNYNKQIEEHGGHYFYRKNRRLSQVVTDTLKKENFKEATNGYQFEDEDLDRGGDCNGGCVFY